MLLPDRWNLRFFPTLAQGFGIDEKLVTDAYLAVYQERISESELFSELCKKLVESRHK